MNGHIPFLAALVPGAVRVVTGEGREVYFVPGGFLEASGPADDYHVIVLADDAEAVDDIDAAEARERVEQARRRREKDSDQEAESELRAALARSDIAG